MRSHSMDIRRAALSVAPKAAALAARGAPAHVRHALRAHSMDVRRTRSLSVVWKVAGLDVTRCRLAPTMDALRCTCSRATAPADCMRSRPCRIEKMGFGFLRDSTLAAPRPRTACAPGPAASGEW